MTSDHSNPNSEPTAKQLSPPHVPQSQRPIENINNEKLLTLISTNLAVGETNLRLLQAQADYIKVSVLDELEKKVSKLCDHTEEREKLETYAKELSEKESSLDEQAKNLAAQKETQKNEGVQLEVKQTQFASDFAQLEVDKKTIKEILTALSTPPTETLPTAFRQISENERFKWVDLPGDTLSSVKLRVMLQLMGIAEDTMSKELYLMGGEECYKIISDIDRKNDSNYTKDLAELLSTNVFNYKFRVPEKETNFDPNWMKSQGQISSVTDVLSWSILDTANNGLKAQVK